MARPVKETVDYFPHFVDTGKTIFVLESKFGNDGYSFWFKLLEILGKSNGHYYDCGNSYDLEFLIAKTRVNEDIATSILNTLATLGSIDKELWINHKVIWCQNLVNNVAEVYRKRKCCLPTRPVFNEKIVSDNGNPSTNELSEIETNHNEVNDTKNPQSKVKESKINQITEKESKWMFVFEERIDSVSSVVVSDIEKYLSKGLEEDLIIKAIDIAVNMNKRSASYVFGILRNFEKNNIRTIKQFEEIQKEPKHSQGSNAFRSYSKEEYEDLDNHYYNPIQEVSK